MRLQKKFIAAFSILALLLTVNMVSAAELELKSNITIVDDIVTLGDLFKKAGEAGKIAVFRAPRLGQKGILKSKRIKQAARDHGLVWRNPRYLENIVIRRAVQTISLDEISTRISDRIRNNYPPEFPNSQLEISLSSRAVPIVLRADIEAEFEIRKIKYNRRSGRFSAIISAPAGSTGTTRIAYKGRATEVIEVPVLAQALGRGQTIGPNQLETRKFSARRISERIITETSDLVGMAVRRSLRANSPIRRSDVEKPKIVKKNTLISVVYKLQSLLITFRGRALQDGAYGETISVLNSRSRRTIQAVVTAPNAVSVQGNKLRQTASLN